MTVRMVVIALATAATACSQSRDGLVFEMLQGGPIPSQKTLNGASGAGWTATSKVDWLQLPAPGTTGRVMIGIRSDAAAKQPGDYRGEVTIGGPEGSKSVVITLHVVPRAIGPKFTYITEPKGCSQPAGGVPLPDQALCVVPDEKPPGNFRAPPAGGTYTDPNFGATVRVLAGPTQIHAYSTPNALSASNKYALTGDLHGEASVIDVATSRVVARPPTPFESAVWDAQDDESYYYFEGVRVLRYNIAAHRSTLIMDYGKAPWHFTKLTNGGSTDTTKDNWIGFWAPAEQSVCALDIPHLKTYCARYDAASIGMGIDPDNGTVLVSKGLDRQSGKRYVWIVGRPAGAMYSVNLPAGKLDFEYLGPEFPDWPGNGDGICQTGERCFGGDHFDMAEDQNGIQYFFGAIETQQPCEFSIYRFQLNKQTQFTAPSELGGGRTRIATLFRCGGDPWTDYHVGCAKASPFCVFSTTYGGFQHQYQANNPLPRGPHIAEVIVVRTDGTEVRRLMKNRAVPMAGEPGNSYWSTPRASLSNDGAWVVVDSNFGDANQQRVLLVGTGLK